MDRWMQYIDDALSSESESESDEAYTNHNDLLLTFVAASDRQPALLAAAQLGETVHVLATLCLLLVGNEKKRVQRSLAKLQIALVLNTLFDSLVWNCRCEDNSTSSANSGQQPPQQAARAHVCVEITVKIQFLRLVYSLCDYSEYALALLLSSSSFLENNTISE